MTEAEPKPTTEPDSPEAAAESPEVTASGTGRRPIFLMVLTAIAVVVFGVAFAFNSEVEDATGFGIDIIQFVAFFSYIGLSLLWVVWILFFSRWDWSTRIMSALAIVMVPFTAFRVLNPVMGGDMTIIGFQPIWSKAPEIPDANEKPASASASLSPVTPFDFPQFLGPDRSGVVQTQAPVQWEKLDSSAIAWQIPVGPAWSGFVAANGFAVTMEQRQDQECVTCYRIDNGELIWIYQHAARHTDSQQMGHVGPRSTPLIHDGRVFAVGALGNFVCLNGTDGSVIWQVDLNSLLGLELEQTVNGEYPAFGEKDSTLEWGRSGSPMVYENTVIIPGGGKAAGPKQTLLAFDVDSGELIWKAGDEMIAYGSPSLQTVDDVPQILMMAEAKGMSFDPQTGEVLWTFDRPGNTAGMANTSQMFAVGDSQVLTSKGYPDGGGILIDLSRQAGQWKTKQVWKSSRVLRTKLTSPVLYDGHAYSISNGFLECARLSDGKRVWKHRGRLGHGQLLLVNDHLVVQSEYGELFVAPATPDGYSEVCSFPTVEATCWNPLCLAGDHLLVRGDLQAACLRLPIAKTKDSEEAGSGDREE